MELDLSLALAGYNPTMIQELDLNRDSNGPTTENHKDHRPKRVFHGTGFETTTLSLVSWNGPPEEVDRHPKCRKLDDESSDDECQVIEGWPPVRKATTTEEVKKSIHVKVKMEGVGIGRKVDLRHHRSYQALTDTLIHMFAKYTKMDRNREEYTLLYQDKEGDWMLVGDVQWENFVESVQRIEILKNDNKMGFGLLSRKFRFQ